jgi:predicted porin
MSLNRKAMVLAVGAALAAPSAYSQTGGDKWEIYGKFYPELTHASGEGATAAGTTVSTLTVAPTGAGGIVNRWEMQINNTYIGFRGQKDLGGGLKAIGQLEQTVNIDESGGAFASRDSFAGLAAVWGTVRLGNMDTPFKKYGDTLGFLGVGSGNFVSPNNVTRRVSNSGGSGFNLRRANAIDFASPTFLGGLQVGVQYSIGNPNEAGTGTTAPASVGINPALNRFPRVVSMGVKWEQGPLYLAAATETHFDLFGGSGLGGAGMVSNAGVATANSKDRAIQLTGVYKIGAHSIELDWNVKQYKETGAAANNSFQEYKNNAYEFVWEARWTNQWRTALSVAKATEGTCSIINNSCSTAGLEATQINLGVAYFLDPSTYLFGLVSRLTNGASGRYNNSTQTPTDGEDITQVAFGISYSF